MTPISAKTGMPDNAVKLKQLVSAHRGVFIASPEYNASITPLLKNTLDWISVVRERGEPQLAAYQNRVFALGGASPGRSGAMQSLIALRQVLAVGCRALVIPEQVTVPNAADAFDEMDAAARHPRGRSAQAGGAQADRLCPHDRGRNAVIQEPRDRLIVALDVSSIARSGGDDRAARRFRVVLQDRLSARLRRRLDFARALAGAGKQIFLDLKLHDIGNTVARGVESVAQLGVRFLTVHAYPQTMHAAVDARGDSGLRILAVTVLTSYDDADLAAAGYDFTVPELVAERAEQARDIGVDGLVCSAEEAANLRAIVGRGMVLVTPGIRPAGAEAGDQKRIMTPAAAIAAGADYLVVGRPIVAARDPKAAAEAIVAEITAAAEKGA